MLSVIARYRAFSLHSRASLIAATILLQALVIGLGWLATEYVAGQGVSGHVIRERVDEQSRSAARFAELLAHEAGTPLSKNDGARDRVQNMVERYRLSAGATLFVVDRDGRMLCHPDIKYNPNIRRSDYADLLITIEPSEEEWLLANLNSSSVMTGRAEVMGIRLVVAMAYVPEADAKVVVTQSVDALRAQGKLAVRGLSIAGGIATIIVLALTGCGSILLVRRYDSLLERSIRVLEAEVARRTRRAVAIRNGLIFGLAKLADYRDTDTGKHLERICRYCEVLALALKPMHAEITEEWIERLKLASSMHDIGKVGIPDSILLKPGKLTPEERTLMERHAAMGADTLMAIRKRVGTDAMLDMCIVVALQHHEKWDGTGYPFKLKSTEIDLSARIVALADIYDALTSPRVYKAAMTHEQAREIIEQSRGSHLDPAVVDAFLHLHAEFDQIRRALLPEDGQAEVPQLVQLVGKAALAAAEDPDMPRACIVPQAVSGANGATGALAAAKVAADAPARDAA